MKEDFKMTKMKKFMGLALAGVMAAGLLAGCGGSGSGASGAASDTRRCRWN